MRNKKFLASNICVFIISLVNCRYFSSVITKQLYYLYSHHPFKFIQQDYVLPCMWMQLYTEL